MASSRQASSASAAETDICLNLEGLLQHHLPQLETYITSPPSGSNSFSQTFLVQLVHPCKVAFAPALHSQASLSSSITRMLEFEKESKDPKQKDNRMHKPMGVITYKEIMPTVGTEPGVRYGLLPSFSSFSTFSAFGGRLISLV